MSEPRSTRQSAAASSALHVARQPILDELGQVFGYELLYRGRATDASCDASGEVASASVLTAALLDLGLDALTGGRYAFLNVTRAVLLGGIETLVPPGGVVLELLETIEVDDDVVAACRDLHARGYRLALDDFVPGSAAEALLPCASFVKVDVLAMTPAELASLAAGLRSRGPALLAEKVENRETHEHARSLGFTLFQGYYFCRPIVHSGAAIPSQKIAYLRLMAALNRPGLTMREVEGLVKQDVALSMRVLRSVNSAATSVRTEVRSLQQALMLLGIDPIRRWASLWCVAALGQDQPPELANLALVRARTCELLAAHVPDPDGADLFLVGLCSLLDVMLKQPMTRALESLPLSEAAGDALQGRQNRLRAILDAVVAQEAGRWDEATEAAGRAGIPAAELAEAHVSALGWLREMSRSQVAA